MEDDNHARRIRYADDLALISSTFTQIQMKIDCLNRNGKGTGLKISIKKTKVMRINVKDNNAVVIDGQEVEEVNSFYYLGARITKHGGAEDDIENRLGKATGAFNKLAKIWRSGELSKNTKIRIFKSNVIAVLLYGCETWRMTKRDEAKLDTFLHKCLRRQICPGLNANEIQIPYDKHHKVSSLVISHQNTHNSVEYEVI